MKRLFLGFAGLAVLLTSVPLVAQQGQSVIIQKIIVKVNGEILTQTDLVQRQIEALTEKNQRKFSPAELQNNANLQSALAEVTPEILLLAVDEFLMVQRARELKITMREDWYQKTLVDIKAQNKLSDEQFEKALLDQLGMTLADYRKMLETQYLMRRVQEQEIAPGMSVTEEEMRQFHTAHPELFQTPATITLREIFVAVPTETKGGEAVVNVAAAEAAEAKIKSARERILKGEDFAVVALEVSESASKSSGGSIGQLNITDLNPQIGSALAKLKAGEITEPIRTGTGFVVYKIDARSETSVRPFEEVRGEIQQRVMGERVGRETEKFLEKQRAIALIEWKDESLKKMYEEALKTRQAGLGKTS